MHLILQAAVEILVFNVTSSGLGVGSSKFNPQKSFLGRCRLPMYDIERGAQKWSVGGL
jgi:hypothetical protein